VNKYLQIVIFIEKIENIVLTNIAHITLELFMQFCLTE